MARADDLLFLSGQAASSCVSGRVAPQVRAPRLGTQARYILESVRALLADQGSDLDHIVKAQIFLRDLAQLDEFDAVWYELCPLQPPRTILQVGPQGFLVPDALVEVDVIAVVRGGRHRIEPIRSDRIPESPSDDVPCIRYGDWIFLAGLMATDFGPEGIAPAAQVDPELPFHSSAIELQTAYTLGNAQALLEDAGSDLDHVVKAQLYLTDLHEFAGMHQVWQRYFTEPPPSTTVQIGGLPVRGARWQADLVAVRKTAAGPPTLVRTAHGPWPIAKHAQGFVAAGFAWPAGHVATDFATGVAPEARIDPGYPFYGSAIERQTENTLDYLDAVLKASGSSLDRVVKAQAYMVDLNDFYGFNKVWHERFPRSPPRTIVNLAGHGLLTPGTLVEIDLIATTEGGSAT